MKVNNDYKKTVNILLIEDNEGDIILTLEALAEAGYKQGISVVKDGEEALKYLKKQSPYEQRVAPNIIFLDISLPKVDGKQVLAFIKSSEGFKHVPVIMLTTSHSEVDINESYSNHANCYITKPVDLDKFFALIKTIQAHWMEVVRLPSN